jgi:8-oxo-dGTP pyrophosphatase MutT (NUDIX family)
MPISPFLAEIRAHLGTRLLLLPSVAAIVRDDAGRILLQKRSDNGAWDLPAGAIDPGEAPAQTIVREVYEETGLIVVPERILGVFGGPGFRFTYPNGDQAEYTITVFACRAIGGSLTPIDGEAAELRYVSPDEMPPLLPKYPQALFHLSPGDPALFVWSEAWKVTPP